MDGVQKDQAGNPDHWSGVCSECVCGEISGWGPLNECRIPHTKKVSNAHCSGGTDIESTPPPLPDVKRFRIGMKGMDDELMSRYGIRKVVRAEAEIVRYRNKRISRYISHQVDRLNKNRKKPTVYWHIVKCLMKNSLSFLVVGLAHVLPQ